MLILCPDINVKENKCVYNEEENTWHSYKILLNTFKQNTPTAGITRITESLIDNSKFNKESKGNIKGKKIAAGELEEITPYKKFQVTKRHSHILEYEAIAETAELERMRVVSFMKRKMLVQ